MRRAPGQASTHRKGAAAPWAEPPAARASSGRRAVAVSLALAAAVVAVYGRTLAFDFVNYDDPGYVTENAVVQRGLSLEGFLWAFAAYASADWHPLTWLSHMLDCELHGLDPAGHHARGLRRARARAPGAERRHAQAEGVLRRALELGKPTAQLEYLLGAALEGQGRAAEARDRYERELRLRPEHAAARRGLARLPLPGTPAAAHSDGG